MKAENNEVFFVEIKHSNEVRKNILETLKGILETLQRFEKFKHLRHKKLESIQKLRIQLKETNKMFGALKLKLPQTNLRGVVVKEVPAHKEAPQKKPKKEKTKEKSKEKPKPAPKKEMTELEKLESELGAIEGKLRVLS